MDVKIWISVNLGFEFGLGVILGFGLQPGVDSVRYNNEDQMVHKLAHSQKICTVHTGIYNLKYIAHIVFFNLILRIKCKYICALCCANCVIAF